MSPPVPLRQILFIRTDRLGETLLTLPAVAALRAMVPQAAVTLLVHPALAPLLAGSPGAERILTFDGASHPLWWVRALRLARQLRPLRFDLAIVSNPMKELHLALRLAGVPHRAGYDRKWGWCLTRRVPDRKALGERHEVEYNLELVKAAIGAPLPPSVPQWPWPSFEREQGATLPSAPFIAVHPWTSNPLKQWPLTRYQAVIRVIAQQRPVVILGGAETRPRVAQVLPTDQPRVANLVGRLTLRQLAATLQRAAALLSNDSGPVHLAAALGTPTVVLFGTPDAATGPRRWGPWGGSHTVIWKASMEAIGIDEVIAAVEQTLARCAP